MSNQEATSHNGDNSHSRAFTAALVVFNLLFAGLLYYFGGSASAAGGVSLGDAKTVVVLISFWGIGNSVLLLGLVKAMRNRRAG